MGLFNAFFIYLLVWWVMLFTVLPLGVEREETPQKGFDAGAPKYANLKRKLVLNSILSAVFVAILWVLVDTGVIRWGEWFRGAIQ